MSVNFILQIVRILHVGNYTEDELEMITNFLLSADEKTLDNYANTNSVVSYVNDLELYIEVVDKLVKIYEEKEMYEKCIDLMSKKSQSLKIKEKETI